MNQDTCNTLKLISLLLDYPGTAWPTLSEIYEQVSALTHTKPASFLTEFLEYLKTHSYEEIAQNYVSTFDFSEETSLYLTYSQHGDHQKRAEILIELRQYFQTSGLTPIHEELPDYLPLLLEFIAIAPAETGILIAANHFPAINSLAESLQKNNNPYAILLKACVLTLEAMIYDYRQTTKTQHA